MIYFFGDTHGHFQHVLEIVSRDRPAAIVFLGDLQAQRPLEAELEFILGMTEVWFIHGNHDTDSDADYDHLFGSALAHRNLHGRVALVDGKRIAGLGGVFRGQVWTPPVGWLYESPEELTARCGAGNRWREGLPRKHRSSIFPADYFRLVSQRADILVTHEAPSSHPHGFEAIDVWRNDEGRVLLLRLRFTGFLGLRAQAQDEQRCQPEVFHGDEICAAIAFATCWPMSS